MAVTIKMISELSGFSRGTVDRVLNNRGKVSPKADAHIKKIAEDFGYKPSLAGKTLAVLKKSYRIGVLLTAEGIPFFDEVIRGVRIAERELSDYGISVYLKIVKGYDCAVQLAAADEMREQVQALILNPICDERVAAKINELVSAGIPVVNVNTDVGGSSRICYVGADYYHNGQTAGGVMSLLLKRENARLALFSGSSEVLGHRLRTEGFADAVKKRNPSWNIAASAYTNDDDPTAYEVAKRTFEASAPLHGVYIAAAGTYGVCRAVRAVFGSERPVIICSDNIPVTREMMREGLVQATICQQPCTQGYQSVKRAFQYLVSGEIPEDYIVKSEIKIDENAG